VHPVLAVTDLGPAGPDLLRGPGTAPEAGPGRLAVTTAGVVDIVYHW
jgi:hypothetical protein